MDLSDQIKGLRAQGYSNREVARMLSCSAHSVSRFNDNTPITEIGQRIIELRNKGLSIKAICKIVGCAKGTASKWSLRCENNKEITKLNQKRTSKTPKNQSPRKNNKDTRIIANHQLRQNRKQYLRSLFGSKCSVCGYSQCEQALDFHHIDPLSKRFSISGSIISQRSIETLIEEVEKCILVCCRCHTEIHYGIINPQCKSIKVDITKIPENIKSILIELSPEIIQKEFDWLNSQTTRLAHKAHQAHQAQRAQIDFELSNIKVCNISRRQFDEQCDKWHYLGKSNKAGKCYNFIVDDNVVGGALITSAIRKSALSNACELSRFFLTVTKQNLATKCLSILIKELKSLKEYTYIQAFSQNDIHLGTIYKAANFKEIGSTPGTYNYNGIHKKTIYERALILGLKEEEYAEKFNIQKISESPKTKYVLKLI